MEMDHQARIKLGVVTIVVVIIASLFGLMLNTCSLSEEQTRPAIACPTLGDQGSRFAEAARRLKKRASGGNQG